MKKIKVVVTAVETAEIEYTTIVEANSKEEAEAFVEKAIERDGTAFIEFDCVNEFIVDSFKIDGEKEVVNKDLTEECYTEGDDSENHF